MNKLISICVLCTGLLVNIVGVYAQTVTTTNVLSPNAASLGLYSEIPVSLYTGTPEISIPLYEVEVKDFKLPISLNYHAAGIHVDQRPGWVGLGWSLFAGGMITRKANGLPDEFDDTNYGPYSGKGFYNRQSSNTTDSIYKLLDSSIWNTESYLKFLTGAGDSYELIITDDKYPDEFYFSFAGYNGMFCLNHKGEWIVRCNKPVKAEALGFYDVYTFANKIMPNHLSSISKCFKGFKITADDGTQYIFGNQYEALEFSAPLFTAANESTGISWIANTWHLTQIILPNGMKIYFTYERDGYNTQIYFNTSYIEMRGDDDFYIWGTWKVDVDCSYVSNSFFRYSGTVIYPSYLKYITTDLAQITFGRSLSKELDYNNIIYNSWESYLNNNSSGFRVSSYAFLFNNNKWSESELSRIKWYKLDNIVVFNKNDKSIIKTVSFNYQNSSTQRLTLGGIKESGKNPYAFSYYKIDQLPPYMANMSDHWGYYNGRVAQETDKNMYYSYREPDIECTKYGIINQITYPTGGYSKFEFEAHDYIKQAKSSDRTQLTLFNNKKYAGGVRIKKITNYDCNNVLTKQKEYFYISDSSITTSSGILGGEIQYRYSYEPQLEAGKSVYIESFSPISCLPACQNTESSHIGYTQVIEKNIDNSYIKYNFTNFDNGYTDQNADFCLQPNYIIYEPYQSRAHTRGQPLNTKYFSNTGNLIKCDSIDYYAVDNEKYNRATNVLLLSVFSNAIQYYCGVAYRINMDVLKPHKQIETIYDINGNNPLTTETTYSYNSFNLIKTKDTQNSNGTTFREEYKYPSDYLISPYSKMVSKNMLSPVIEKITTVDTRETARVKNNYTSDDFITYGKILPANVQTSYTGTNGLKSEITYDFYDEKGNVQQYTSTDGVPTTILWGYCCQYPVVEIKNTTYAQVADILTETVINRMAIAHTPTTADLTSVNNLRTNSNLQDALITTYTHKPLVGLETVTDSRGIATNYEYDAFGRLAKIKLDGKIAEEYNYNYSSIYAASDSIYAFTPDSSYTDVSDSDYTDSTDSNQDYLTVSPNPVFLTSTLSVIEVSITTSNLNNDAGISVFCAEFPSWLDMYKVPGKVNTWRIQAKTELQNNQQSRTAHFTFRKGTSTAIFAECILTVEQIKTTVPY
jgi:YD repeat-containing protein